MKVRTGNATARCNADFNCRRCQVCHKLIPSSSSYSYSDVETSCVDPPTRRLGSPLRSTLIYRRIHIIIYINAMYLYVQGIAASMRVM